MLDLVTKNIPIKLIKENHRPFRNIDLSEIEYNQIKYSIKEFGILNPVHVRIAYDGKYEIFDGHHRLKAAIELGIKELPCVIHHVSVEKASQLYLTLGLTPIELKPKDIMRSLQKIMKSRGQINLVELATQLGISVQRLKKYIKIVDIEDPTLLALIDSGDLLLTNAYELARLRPNIRYYYLGEARVCTSRNFRLMVDKILREELCNKVIMTRDEYIENFQGQIKRKNISFCKKELKTLFILSKYRHVKVEEGSFEEGYILGLQVSLGIDPLSVDQLMSSKSRKKRDLL